MQARYSLSLEGSLGAFYALPWRILCPPLASSSVWQFSLAIADQGWQAKDHLAHSMPSLGAFYALPWLRQAFGSSRWQLLIKAGKPRITWRILCPPLAHSMPSLGFVKRWAALAGNCWSRLGKPTYAPLACVRM